MVRTRHALISYFRMAACHTLSKVFSLNHRKHGSDSADVGDTFTQDFEVEDLFCGAPSSSEPSLFFSNYLFSSACRLSIFKMTFSMALLE